VTARRSVLAIAAVAALGGVARAQEAQVTLLTGEELAPMLAKKDFFLVNVHIPYEGEIEGTDAFIPYDTMAESLDRLPRDRNAKIVVYCKVGGMSDYASRHLLRLGFTRVFDLKGGMIGWEASGRRIVAK
jgi:rhodanese-related sulfurtransferase